MRVITEGASNALTIASYPIESYDSDLSIRALYRLQALLTISGVLQHEIVIGDPLALRRT